MYQCKSCGAQLPDHAHFCGNCGQASSDPSEWPTQASGLPTVKPGNRDTPTALITSSAPPSQHNINQAQENSVLSIPDLTTVSLDEENDEENKRRAALLGFGLPFLDNQSLAGHVPMVEGTPQAAQVPFVQGTPQVPAAPGNNGGHALGSLHSSVPIEPAPFTHPLIAAPISHPTPVPHTPHSSSPSHPGHSHHTDHGRHSHHAKAKRHTPWVIAAIITPIIIIVTIIGAGFTIWAPVLSLSGGTDVVLGGTLHLHGSNFIPGSSVTLMLDGVPFYFTREHSSRRELASTSSQSAAALPTISRLLFSSSNTITAAGDGTFNVLIPVNLNWSLGRHTIRASEAITQRSAELTFTIYLPGTLPTPVPSGTSSQSPTNTPSSKASPTATKTPSPKGSPTPTPTAALPGLGCVNPSSVTLGPVSEGYAHAVSAPFTLCTRGSGTVSWNATWDAKSASWLQLDKTSGQIQAPGQQQINVSGLASQLRPGNYKATVTFSGQPGNSTVTFNVTFTVQAGCINATPQSLNFVGVAGMSDPPMQSVTVSNCGAIGTWSETAQTADGSNWLSASPAGGNLDRGATSNVTVTASNLNAKLPPGTYSGKLLFGLGSGSSIVYVTLTVQAPPTLSVNPSSLYANQQCNSSTQGYWVCYVILTNNSASLSLSWSASSTGVPGINFTPSSDTIPPGQTERVEITVPFNDCQTTTTLIFTGPANTVNVPWTCSVIG